ncbi:MAG: DUF4911 domain-containing protein [Peptococcaceae bacterium]|nr:DUF4911 domain-containing protein [Peptococcaceae bacterium]
MEFKLQNKKDSFGSDSDLLVKAKVARSEIQLLAKYVEGMGHLGVVTTTDRMTGEVVIQTTRFCWPELEKLLSKLPLKIIYL